MTVAEAIKNLEEERDSLCELVKYPVMKNNSKAIKKRLDAIACAIEALDAKNNIEKVIERLKLEACRCEVNRIKAGNLGDCYTNHVMFYEAKEIGINKAIAIIEEVMKL